MAGLPLNIPVTASQTSMPDWIRKAADAVNRGLDYMRALRIAVDAATAAVAAMDSRVTMLETDVPAIDARVTALEAEIVAPTVTNVIFTPAALPSSPVEGQTAMDSSDHKLKTWDGSIWQSHW